MSRRSGLAVRLRAAQVAVLATGVIVAGLVAAVAGPPIFHAHLAQAAHDATPAMAAAHAERAFRTAGALSLTVALLAALTVAVAVSVFVTRRIARPVRGLAAAARQVAAGRYDVHLPAADLGPEFDTLTTSFAAMADRLAAVEATRRRLLADLAHEMRTPIATLDGYLTGFEDGVATLDADTAGMLRAQTRRLARLAEDITAVSQAEEHQLDLHPVPTPPGALVEAAAAAAADQATERGVALQAAVAPELPVLVVDPDRIGQVLGNLLENALRHTPRGGRVRLSAEPGAGAVILRVADTGTGIAAEHLPHVFERFYRADAARDRAHGGSGIGLAIAKALVEAHGGTIAATSTPGAGAAFTVTLPTRRGAAALQPRRL